MFRCKSKPVSPLCCGSILTPRVRTNFCERRWAPVCQCPQLELPAERACVHTQRAPPLDTRKRFPLGAHADSTCELLQTGTSPLDPIAGERPRKAGWRTSLPARATKRERAPRSGARSRATDQ